MTTTTMKIDPQRLAILDTISLGSGDHESLEEGACVMELVGYIAGEPWSDHPQCACPTITSFRLCMEMGS